MGLCSRKQAVEYVFAGRVRVNGTPVYDPGFIVRASDTIEMDGQASHSQKKIYIVFHKPAGCVTTRQDELGRRTVYSYLGDLGQWLFPVGRLDMESEGLLLFTNDTAFGNRLTDPQYKIPRTYNVTLSGPLAEPALEQIRKGGVVIGRGELTGPAELTVIDDNPASFTVRITITEGKNRELRRLFEAFNRKVTRLLRTDYGDYALNGLEPGQWREIKPCGPAAPVETAAPRPAAKNALAGKPVSVKSAVSEKPAPPKPPARKPFHGRPEREKPFQKFRRKAR